MESPMEIFCCYAREDRSFLNKLKMHLMQLQREGLISIWNDTDISPGTNYEEEIDRHLKTADIILLLVSADFMASEYCYSVEMKRAMERHERGEAYVIPIILRPIYWQQAPFGKLQALPRDGKSIASSDWTSADEALFDVAEGIRETLKELASRGSIEFSIQQGDVTTFNYRDIQEFAAKVLNILDNVASATRHLAMTIHGAGFGLDEIEAFLAQITGYLQALQSKQFPANLEKITIIDRDSERVQRLRQAFEENFAHAGFVSKARNRWNYRLETRELKGTSNSSQQSTLVTEKVGIESEAKPHVFVAMPFKKDMDDVFYYGIFQPVRASGFICERIDQEAFIGDILDQVKKKNQTAAVVIAELSGANPNVYLEVGYAWGKGRPTILLMKDEQELRFDV